MKLQYVKTPDVIAVMNKEVAKMKSEKKLNFRYWKN